MQKAENNRHETWQEEIRANSQRQIKKQKQRK